MRSFKSPISYREDINGLRAWAVVAVLLFHFQIPGFTAGFMGVDLFFVISGYLMTAIVIKGLEGQKFSLLQFYLARVRRIVPALMVLLAVLLVLGWFWLPTPDYKTLGAQSAYSLSFLSNIHFWRATGYFDSAAHEKWLLHTWTLGVEFQFYILYPVFLLVLWKIKASVRMLFVGIALAFVASLLLSLVFSGWKPAASFYLLPTRGWEFLAGGLSLLILREFPDVRRFGRFFLWAGLGFWLVALVVLDSSFAWPSGWALLPVLSASLVILAQQESSILTVNPVMQWLGNRSYSLYLWHWPIVVALYFAGVQQESGWILGGIALSLILADLSYRLVETPTRIQLTRLALPKQIAGFALAGLVIGVSAVAVRLFEFDGRLPKAYQLAAAEKTNWEPRSRNECKPKEDNTSPACIYGNGDPGVIMIGDSHAMSTITALARAAEKYEKSAIYLGRSGGRPVYGLQIKDDPTLFLFHEWLLKNKLPEYKASNIPIVHVTRLTGQLMGPNESHNAKPSAYFDSLPKTFNDPVFNQQFKEAFIQTACDIAARNPFYITRPIPEIGIHVPDTLSRNILLRRDSSDIKITLDEYHERHAFTWAMQDEAAAKCGVKILDPLPYLCDEQYCYGSRDGRPLYYDDDHLSEYGNKFLVPMFEQVFAGHKKAGSL